MLPVATVVYYIYGSSFIYTLYVPTVQEYIT